MVSQLPSGVFGSCDIQKNKTAKPNKNVGFLVFAAEGSSEEHSVAGGRLVEVGGSL